MSWLCHTYQGLFYGFGSTAMRDAPYAGLYVLMYEHGKTLIRGRSGIRG